MLNNEKFVNKAPAAKVQEEREKLENLSADDGSGKRKAGRIKSKTVLREEVINIKTYRQSYISAVISNRIAAD